MASQWAARRKLVYAIFVFIAAIFVIGVPLFFFFYKTPTCGDGVQNQNEKGIDCGGICTRICPVDIAAPLVLWQRSFSVSDGVYNSVAYIQNPNVLTRVDSVNYVFRLYDKDNTIIGERTGRTFIPASQTFAVFEAGIRTGGRVPVRTSFSFTDSLVWSQNPAGLTAPVLTVENIASSNENLAPRIDAVIHNKSLKVIANLEAVAIVYDTDDNAIAASRTVVQNLAAGASTPVTFTWPAPWAGSAVRKEVVLRVYPSGSAF